MHASPTLTHASPTLTQFITLSMYRKGVMTASRRASPAPQVSLNFTLTIKLGSDLLFQLSCSHGAACDVQIDKVQCENVGLDEMGEVAALKNPTLKN